MKHIILILLICICSNIAAFTYNLPADTRRVNVEMKCESCGKYYTISRLYSEQINTYFTNDFEPCYCDHFMCSSCKEDKKSESFVFIVIIFLVGGFIFKWLSTNSDVY